jgi:hypothetical protein
MILYIVPMHRPRYAVNSVTIRACVRSLASVYTSIKSLQPVNLTILLIYSQDADGKNWNTIKHHIECFGFQKFSLYQRLASLSLLACLRAFREVVSKIRYAPAGNVISPLRG